MTFLYVVAAFAAGWAARALLDAVLTKAVMRVLSSAIGKDKLREKLAEMAVRHD